VSLTIIDSPRKLREFQVYDFEWIPGTLKIRLCGIFDGRRYRSCYSIDNFLNLALTSANRGQWFFAHAGGLADVQFVFEKLVHDPRYSVRASFSGSSAIIVKVTQGKNCWTFVDSYWLLRDSLKNIGKWIGIEKPWADEDREWYATVDIDTLTIRNRVDCEILYAAILNFEAAILEEGGQLQMTLASTAMHLFRRRYLKQTIATNEWVNNIARQSYFASRVEVFNKESSDRNYFDINSSFPYAMTEPSPGPLIRTYSRLPDQLFKSQSPCFIARASLEVPDSYLPPVPTRREKRVFFPTGKLSGWFTGVDLQLALEEGARITKVWEVLEFEPFYDLSSYATTLYERRRKSTNDFEKIVLKLLLNSLYGKFAESPNKQVLYINPSADKLEKLAQDAMLMPGVWIDILTLPLAHVHVPISTHITSIARRTLYRYLSEVKNVDYCDTDGFSTSSTLCTGTGLGELKLEKIVDELGYYQHPKFYKQKCLVNGERKTIVKAKGFSLGRDEKRAEMRFDLLVNNWEINVERMTRIRENMRNGIVCPNERTVWKKLSGDSIGKRFFYPDGNSRPWSVDELLDMGL
jgi:hypothetical protein